jgi:lysophospholipase L1-like esterase
MVAAMLMLFSAGDAGAASKRILIIGDSWAHFMFGDGGFRTALRNAGLEEFQEWNNPKNNTAAGGTRASQWAEDAAGLLTNAKEEIQNEPTLDIVWATLGGNDLMDDWRPWDSPETQAASFSRIGNYVRYVVEQILAVRPTVRFIINGYDYMNCIRRYSGTNPSCYDLLHARFPTLWPWNFGDPAIPQDEENMTPAQAHAFLQVMNAANVALGEELARVALSFPGDRVRFINNFGVLQLAFGYPGNEVPYWVSPYPILHEHEPHWDAATVDAFRFAPGTTAYPRPGQYPDFTPFAGGDSSFMKSPWEAFMFPPADDWIHLSTKGHVAIAENCLNVIMREWLLNPLGDPEVLSIEPVAPPNDRKEVGFEVVFNKAVTGVDPTDFLVSVTGNLESGEVLMVAPISEEGGKSEFSRKYSVLVQLGAGGGGARLDFVDNDSVSDADAKKVGGTGQGNGSFSAGVVAEVYGVPMAAWPAALLVACLGILVLVRRLRGLHGLE